MLFQFNKFGLYLLAEFKFARLQHVGKGSKIFPRSKFMRPKKVYLGEYTSIGDFVFVETGLKLGNFSEMLTYSTTTGREDVEVGDFVAISHNAVLFTSVDTYKGDGIANSNVPDEFRTVRSGKIIIGDHAMIGAGALIFPGVHIGEGACIGSGSVVHNDIEPWTVNVGVPAKPIKTREKERLLQYGDILYKRYKVDRDRYKCGDM